MQIGNASRRAASPSDGLFGYYPGHRLPGLDASWMLPVPRLLAVLYPCLVQAFQAHKNDRLATGNVACLDSFTVNEDQIARQIFQTK